MQRVGPNVIRVALAASPWCSARRFSTARDPDPGVCTAVHPAKRSTPRIHPYVFPGFVLGSSRAASQGEVRRGVL